VENSHDKEKNIDSKNIVPQKRKSRLPIIALIFSCIPVFVSLVIILLSMIWTPYILFLLLAIMLYSILGLPFYIIGIIIAIFALYKRKERIGTMGQVLSIIAIAWSFVSIALIWMWRFVFLTATNYV